MRFRDGIAQARADRMPLLAFNIVDLASLQGVLAAADRAGRPVIVQCSARTVELYSARALVAMARGAAGNVPAFLHLDHCARDDVLGAALEAGFDGIMADGSGMPRARNLEWTTGWARRAHDAGAVIEGEVTAVHGSEDSFEAAGDGPPLTPDQFLSFAATTGVDLLGAHIGTAHGVYASPPVIDFAFVRAVRDAAAGFVVHGGSGLAAETLARFADEGAVKINFSTELKQAWSRPMSTLGSAVPEPIAALGAARSAISELAAAKFAACQGKG